MSERIETEGEEQRETPSTVDELASRLAASEALSPDIAQVIAMNWRKVLGMVALLLLCVWVYGKYQEAEAEKRQELSDKFSEAQMLFSKVALNKGGEGNNQAQDADRVQLEQALKVIERSRGGTYRRLAQLYTAALNIQAGRAGQAKESLEGFDVDAYKSARKQEAKPLGADDFLNELASLLWVRAELLKDPHSPAAQEMLENLVLNANWVNVEALVFLAKLQGADASREDLKKKALLLVGKRAEFRDLVSGEMSPFGIEIASDVSLAAF